MKHLILWIIWVLLSIHVLFTSQVSAQLLSLSADEQATIIRVFDWWYNKIEPRDQYENLNELEDKISIARLARSDNWRIDDILNFIQQLAIQAKNNLEPEEELFTNPPLTFVEENAQEANASNERLFWFSPNEYRQGTKIVLAWIRSAPVSRRELIAQREQIAIDTIELTASRSIDRAVSNVIFLDENGYLIWTARPQWNTATIRNINYLLPIGATDVYIVLETRETGDTKPGEEIGSFSFDLEVTGNGERSDAEVTQSYNWDDDTIIITPIQITDARLIRECDNYEADNRLFDNTETDIALFVLETWDSSNYRTDAPSLVKTLVEELTFRFFNWTTDGTFASTFTLKRTDKNTNKISWSVNGNEVTFDLTQLSKEWNIIENDDIAIFMISASFNLSPWTDDEFIELILEDPDNWWILYRSNSPWSQLIDGLYLQKDINSLSVEE